MMMTRRIRSKKILLLCVHFDGRGPLTVNLHDLSFNKISISLQLDKCVCVGVCQMPVYRKSWDKLRKNLG